MARASLNDYQCSFESRPISISATTTSSSTTAAAQPGGVSDWIQMLLNHARYKLVARDVTLVARQVYLLFQAECSRPLGLFQAR